MAWVPAHVGTDGNEQAGTLAKQGAQQVNIEDEVKLGLTEIE